LDLESVALLHGLGVLRLYPLQVLRCLGSLGLKLAADGRQRLRGLRLAGLLLVRGMAGLLYLFLGSVSNVDIAENNTL
jgi:hypothetical protein